MMQLPLDFWHLRSPAWCLGSMFSKLSGADCPRGNKGHNCIKCELDRCDRRFAPCVSGPLHGGWSASQAKGSLTGCRAAGGGLVGMMRWGLHSSSELLSTCPGRLACRTLWLKLVALKCDDSPTPGLLHKDGRFGGQCVRCSGVKGQSSQVEVGWGVRENSSRCPGRQSSCSPHCGNRISMGIVCRLPGVDASHLDDLDQVSVGELGSLLHQTSMDAALLRSGSMKQGLQHREAVACSAK